MTQSINNYDAMYHVGIPKTGTQDTAASAKQVSAENDLDIDSFVEISNDKTAQSSTVQKTTSTFPQALAYGYMNGHL